MRLDPGFRGVGIGRSRITNVANVSGVKLNLSDVCKSHPDCPHAACRGSAESGFGGWGYCEGTHKHFFPDELRLSCVA